MSPDIPQRPERDPDIAALLGSVGLGHLAPRLTQNEIDWETARLMKTADLADVGMTSQEAALFRAAVARVLDSERRGIDAEINAIEIQASPFRKSQPPE